MVHRGQATHGLTKRSPAKPKRTPKRAARAAGTAALRRPTPIAAQIATALVGARTPRDGKKSSAHYRKVALVHARAIDGELRRAYIKERAPHEAIECAIAMYSGGGEIRAIKRVLRFGVELELLRYQQLNFALEQENAAAAVELVVAAALVDSKLLLRLGKARGKCTWAKPAAELEQELVRTLLAMLTGQGVTAPSAAALTALRKRDRYLAAIGLLVRKLVTGGKRNTATTQSKAIQAFLEEGWLRERVKEREANAAMYGGLWCLFAAAMCKRFGVAAQVVAPEHVLPTAIC